MKRLFACLALLCLLLAGCTTPPREEDESTAPPEIETQHVSAGALCGTWVNEGQYEPGRDFVETMTLQKDGSAVIHLDYQGNSYATLVGRWKAQADTLSVTFTDGKTRDRIYQYALTETTLTLTGDGKVVEYTRQK